MTQGERLRPHLASLLDEWRSGSGGTAVVSHRGVRTKRTSYFELANLAGRFAAELRLLDVRPGERIVLWGENSAEWIAAFFGCVLCAALPVPLDAGGTPEFAQRVMAEVSPRLIVGDAAKLALLTGEVPRLVLGDMRSWTPPGADFGVDPAVTLDAPVQIVFTSGTTSEPKGVVHTHRNILASVGPIEHEIARYRRYQRPFQPLRFLHTLPLSHVFGQFMGMWLPPLLRAEVHFVDSVEPGRFVTLIRRERVSVLVAVPRILELLRVYLVDKFPELPTMLAASAGIPAWKRWWRFRAVHRVLGWKFWAMICGGATLPAELEDFWNGVGLALIQGYGMTETAALVTLNHPFYVGKGTLGRTLPGREIRLSAEGEIEVRGDMLAAGSWRGGHFEPRAEGWLATGDLGSQESSGELRFTGRKSDTIVTAAGMNIHPQDLEAALLTQAGVRACAVVGCETPGGLLPVGVVVFSGTETEFAGVREKANAGLAGFQQMRYALRWPEPQLPYTSTGKLLRRKVSAWACAEIATARLGNSDPEQGTDRLLALIGEIAHEPAASGAGEQRLTEDLHLDSLGLVQLQSALAARFGVEIGDSEMGALRTLAALRERLRMAGAEAGALGVSQGTVGPFATASSATEGGSRYLHWPWKAPVRWLRGMFTEAVLRPLVWWMVKPGVKGRAGIAGEAGPVLFIANHVNTFDLPVVLYALPKKRRSRLVTAMSAEVLQGLREGRGQGSWWRNLLAQPAYWLVVALFNVFPLPRLSGFRRSFAHAGEALDQGYSVLVFPEGRRSGTGILQPFRPGIGLLVQACNVPVIPLALQGVGGAVRDDGRWFRTGKVAVQFGAPVQFSGGETPEEITAALWEALRRLGPN